MGRGERLTAPAIMVRVAMRLKELSVQNEARVFKSLELPSNKLL
jgi:hypothetical protein